MLIEWAWSCLHDALAIAQAFLAPAKDAEGSKSLSPAIVGSPGRIRRLSRTATASLGSGPCARSPRSDQAFCILALDGHGTSVLFHAILLERLWQEHPDFLDRIDLFAGTSGGAITALLLAYAYTPSEIVAIYRHELPQLVSAFPLWMEWRLLWPFRARFSEHNKQAMLFKYFGRARLGDLPKPVLVTAFDLEGRPQHVGRSHAAEPLADAPISAVKDVDLKHWEPVLFSNLPPSMRRAQEPKEDSLSLTLVDVAMRATASPSYFPIFQGHIDGTVFANNPALTAVARAAASFPSAVNSDNAVVLSLGGPLAQHAQALTRADWGLIQWLPWLVALLFSSTHAALDNAASVLLKQRYLRLVPAIPSTLRLDHLSSVEPLVAMASHQTLTEASAFVRAYLAPGDVLTHTGGLATT